MSSAMASKTMKFKINYMKSVVWNWRENWSPTLREEYKLMVFEDKVQRRTFAVIERKQQETGAHVDDHHHL
jgi:hypothetical protein